MTYRATYSDGQRQTTFYVQADTPDEAEEKARRLLAHGWRLVSVAESAEQWEWVE